jgi:esterase/lipase superfamily enzyme
MRREQISVEAPEIGGAGDVVVYGTYGLPVLAFPSEKGRATDYEDRGMIGAAASLIEQGRTKIYSVDSFDAGSWFATHLSLEERAAAHARYEDWIINQVVHRVYEDCQGPLAIMVTGCSFGAFHAANFALRRPDIFPLALCHSGVYDMAGLGHGPRGDSYYFNNPMDYVANMEGEHLDWVRSRARITLVCGQGQWEDTTGALQSTTDFARLLAKKGLHYELDLWGYDVPHDWPSWRNQFAHHLQRFC